MKPALRWVTVWVLLLALGLFGVWCKRKAAHGVSTATSNKSAGPALYEPSDKPATIFLRVLSPTDGGSQVVPAVIHRSKSRLNQMKQAVLMYLKAPRQGLKPLSPPGVVLNEMYLTKAGSAVVDLSVPACDTFGFYDEAQFVSGLSHVLTQNFEEVKKVRLLNDGVESGTLTGHFALGTAESMAGSPFHLGTASP
jgi:hypothetical protein